MGLQASLFLLGMFDLLRVVGPLLDPDAEEARILGIDSEVSA